MGHLFDILMKAEIINEDMVSLKKQRISVSLCNVKTRNVLSIFFPCLPDNGGGSQWSYF